MAEGTRDDMQVVSEGQTLLTINLLHVKYETYPGPTPIVTTAAVVPTGSPNVPDLPEMNISRRTVLFLLLYRTDTVHVV